MRFSCETVINEIDGIIYCRRGERVVPWKRCPRRVEFLVDKKDEKLIECHVAPRTLNLIYLHFRVIIAD